MTATISPKPTAASRRLAREMGAFARQSDFTSDEFDRLSATFSAAKPEILMDAILLAEDAEGAGLGYVLLMLTSSSDPFVRASACGALGRLGVEEAIPVLRGLLVHYNPYQRAGAAQGLQSLGVREAIPEIEALLDDPAPLVVGNAIRALAGLRAHGTAPRIARFLSGPEGSLRLAAARALATLGAVEWAPRIVPMLFGTDEIAQAGALAALRTLRVPTGAARIVELVECGPGLVAGPAMEAASSMGIRAAIPALRRRLEDPDRRLRARATVALAQLGDHAGVPRLLETEKHVDALNALRYPATWAKLDSIPLKAFTSGSPRDLLDRIASDVGLRVEADPRVRRRLGSDFDGSGIQERPGTWLDLLRAMLPKDVAFVLEQETIRVLPRNAARREWSQWWQRKNSARPKEPAGSGTPFANPNQTHSRDLTT